MKEDLALLAFLVSPIVLLYIFYKMIICLVRPRRLDNGKWLRNWIIGSNVEFLLILIEGDAPIQFTLLFILGFTNVFLIFAALVVSSRRLKIWGLATILLQVLIVCGGLLRVELYTARFRATKDKPILFVKETHYGTSWCSAPEEAVFTYYYDGTIHKYIDWGGRTDCCPDEGSWAFWEREAPDTSTMHWNVVFDASSANKECDVVFNVDTKTFSAQHIPGDTCIVHSVNWDLLRQMAKKYDRDTLVFKSAGDEL